MGLYAINMKKKKKKKPLHGLFLCLWSYRLTLGYVAELRICKLQKKKKNNGLSGLFTTVCQTTHMPIQCHCPVYDYLFQTVRSAYEY